MNQVKGPKVAGWGVQVSKRPVFRGPAPGPGRRRVDEILRASFREMRFQSGSLGEALFKAWRGKTKAKEERRINAKWC